MKRRKQNNTFDYDFSGWATKYNVGCSDGRTILPGAFQHADTQVVPLIYNHNHDDPNNVVGKALLHSTEDGVYCYGSFNNSKSGKSAKKSVAHGDIDALSIYANHLRESQNGEVYHGDIKEVSLVLSGANIEAKIDNVMCHGSEDGQSAIIYSGVTGLQLEDELMHGEDEGDDDMDGMTEQEYEETLAAAEEDFNSLTDEGRDVMYAMLSEVTGEEYDDETELTDQELLLGMAMMSELEEGDGSDDDDYDDEEDYDEDDEEDYDDEEGDDDDEMKHNDFDCNEMAAAYDAEVIGFADAMLKEAKTQNKSFRDTVMAHSDEFSVGGSLMHGEDGELYHGGGDDGQAALEAFMATYPRVEHETPGVDYGVTNIDNLYPEPTAVGGIGVIRRRTDWVGKVLNGASKTGFSRIRATYADFKEDQARAKGYIKGSYKKSEVISLLRRKTEPATIYVKNTFDRDDLIDTESVLSLAPMVKGEMRKSLDEEKALAMLVGDGRDLNDEDKIKPDAIRPIACEPDLFNIKWQVATSNNFVWDVIAACRKSRKNYRGSGNMTMFTSEWLVSRMLVAEDALGRKMFPTRAALAKRLGVEEIVTVPRFFVNGDFITVPYGDGTRQVLAVLINMKDYTVGTDKHSHAAFFEDFDIDFNKEKYLLEERFCGAMTEPFSAITLFLAPVSDNTTKSLEPTITDSNGNVVDSTFKAAFKGKDTKTKVKSDRKGYEASGNKYFGKDVPASDTNGSSYLSK